MRSDSAGYQRELLLYCGEGKDTHFGTIDFAVSVDVTPAFTAAARSVQKGDSRALTHCDGANHPVESEQEWEEVRFVPRRRAARAIR